MKTILLGIILALSPFTVKAEEIPFPKLTGRVVDTANQIPDDQEKILNDELTQFEKSTKHQFVIVTIPDLKGQDVDEYTNKLGRHWGIGRKEVDDGIILFQSPGDGKPGSGKIRIEVGYGMEYILTDATTSRVIRNIMVPILKQDKPREETTPEAILAGAREIMRLGAITPEQITEDERLAKERQRKASAAVKDFFITALSVIGAFIGAIGIWFVATAKKRRLGRERIEALRKAERERSIELERLIEQERANARERARLAREKMLADMSPSERKAFLRTEELEADLKRHIAARRREVGEQQRRLRKEKEERDQRGSQSSSSYSGYTSFDDARSSSSYSGSSSSSSDSFSGGGGDFGGGGSSSDY